MCDNVEKVNTMENSINDSVAEKPFKSPPRRRRSTFFERRDSMVPQPVSENEETDKNQKESEDTKYLQDIKSYHNKLLFEKSQWKNEVNERRNKYHDLKKQFQMLSNAPSHSSMSYSALSNEDIEFLKGKPNISKLIEGQQKLHKSVKENMALKERANELEDIILRECENKVNAITEYIFENSTI